MEANSLFTHLSNAKLEHSITRLCADINAATYHNSL